MRNIFSGDAGTQTDDEPVYALCEINLKTIN